MRTRIIVGLILGALLVASLLISKWTFIGFVLLAMIVSVYEINSALKSAGYTPVKWIAYIYAVAIIPTHYFTGFGGTLGMMMACTFSVMCMVVINKNVRFIDMAVTLFTFIYPLLPFTFLIFMALITDEKLRLLMLFQIFICTYASDTFAYFGGTFFGKRKFCERLSPKKTYAGAIAGVLGSLLMGFLFMLFSKSIFEIDFAIHNYVIIALICGIIAQMGDLFASAVKRYCNIKDFGTILPGHGGLLDRIDSILFTTPVVSAYYVLFMINQL